MATRSPDSKQKNLFGASRRQLLFAIAISSLLVVMLIAALAVIRDTSPRSAAVKKTSSTPPAALTTAADYLAQGDFDFDLGNYGAAIASYSRALELKPDFAEAYNNRAYAYMTVKKYEQALPDLDQALRLRPDYVNALMNRGDIYNYYYQIDRARAIADYDRVLELDPDAPNYTSVCGHRMLATHNGWSPGIYVEILQHGIKSGCPENINLQ